MTSAEMLEEEVDTEKEAEARDVWTSVVPFVELLRRNAEMWICWCCLAERLWKSAVIREAPNALMEAYEPALE